MVHRFEDDFLEDMSFYQLKVQFVELSEDFSRHSHTFSEVVVVLGGTAEHVVGDQAFEITAGDVFVIGGDQVHGFERVNDLRIINFSFSEKNLLFDREELWQLPGFAPCLSWLRVCVKREIR